MVAVLEISKSRHRTWQTRRWMGAGPGANGCLVVAESVPDCLNIAQVLLRYCLRILVLEYHSTTIPVPFHYNTPV
jgi:hypothetical protein